MFFFYIDKEGKQFTLLLVINQRVLFDQMVKVSFVCTLNCLVSYFYALEYITLWRSSKKKTRNTQSPSENSFSKLEQLNRSKGEKMPAVPMQLKINAPNNDWLFRTNMHQVSAQRALFQSIVPQVFTIWLNVERERKKTRTHLSLAILIRKPRKYYRQLYYFLVQIVNVAYNFLLCFVLLFFLFLYV